MRRVRAGLRACWDMRRSTFPRGTYVAVFLVACWCAGSSAWTTGRVNMVDASFVLLSGYLMVSTFIEGFRAATPRVEARSPESAS